MVSIGLMRICLNDVVVKVVYIFNFHIPFVK